MFNNFDKTQIEECLASIVLDQETLAILSHQQTDGAPEILREVVRSITHYRLKNLGVDASERMSEPEITLEALLKSSTKYVPVVGDIDALSDEMSDLSRKADDLVESLNSQKLPIDTVEDMVLALDRINSHELNTAFVSLRNKLDDVIESAGINSDIEELRGNYNRMLSGADKSRDVAVAPLL